jgi:isopentenyldiphosphate isomerase
MSNKPELIYTVDDSGNLLELEPREDLHLTSLSKRHAAVIGMIVRSDGKFLMQWRAQNKLGGGRLDVSATTHVRKGETYESALRRSFDNELGIRDNMPLRHAFDFRYEEDLGSHKENEYCKVYYGKYDGGYSVNPAEIDSVKFMTLLELKRFISESSDRATKWLRETAMRMEPKIQEIV